MDTIKTTNKHITQQYSKIYALPYCRIDGRDPEDFPFFRDLIKDKLGYDLIPVKYYNCGLYGWNWTGYASTSSIFFITGYYRSIPAKSESLLELLGLN